VNQNLEIAFAKKKNVECQTRALQLLQLVGLNLGCGCFHLLSKSIEIATICLYKVSERKRASLEEDEHTRDGSREMAADIILKQLHPLLNIIPLNSFVRSFCYCFI